MLALFDWRLVAGCVVAMGLIYLIFSLSEKRIFRLIRLREISQRVQAA